MDKQVISRLEDEIHRDIINALLEYYNTPEFLRQAYWKAYNAGHKDEARRVSLPACNVAHEKGVEIT